MTLKAGSTRDDTHTVMEKSEIFPQWRLHTLTLLHALALSDDIHLRRVLGAVRALHADAAALYPLGSAAVVAARAHAVGHLDHLVGSTAVLLQELPVLFFLAGRGWNKEFCILVLSDLSLPRKAAVFIVNTYGQFLNSCSAL